MTPEALLLQKQIKDVVPQHNREATWLLDHRPSIAFAICIGAGPWKIGRRSVVQKSFIKAIGKRDLRDPVALRKLIPACQLDWQNKWFEQINKGLIKLSNKARHRVLFDDLFWPGIGLTQDKIERFELLIGCSIHRAPKVVQLFVRDYMFVQCFPVDRHVRRWLEERKLPNRSDKVVALFKELGLNPSGYSRSIFNSKAANPTFEPTR